MTNLDRIAKIFPECVTETEVDGKLTRAINFDTLRQLLSDELTDGREAYEFTFVGKKRAQLDAHAATSKTLRPARNLSRDFDTTQNLYIEGDNLDALKILTESYLGRVKLIYIDPPYNTGNDFIYRDNFKQSESDFDDAAGNVDGDGNRLRKNPESNGRFHSDWCAMIYARLAVAKHFLSDDGVIFISIDDHEQATLKLICDELFGEKNFVANVIWEKKYSPQNDAKWLSDNHDFILIYAKDKEIWRPNLLPRTEEMNARYANPDNDPRGAWKSTDFTAKTYSPSGDYPITLPSGRVVNPPASRAWITNRQRFEELLADNRISFGANGDGVPRKKTFLSEVQQGKVSKTIWLRDEVGDNQDGKREVKAFNLIFDSPKPTRLIKRILQLSTDAESIVLDFFSGSATTAQAVMELNASDGGHRKFVMIQLPEETPDKSEARRAGYKTICDIGRERIRRAGDKLKAAHPTLDTGFRTFKVDESNFAELPEKITQDALAGLVENIKPDRNAWDLLFGALLDMGLTLDLPVASEMLDGFEVLSYGDEILACFGKNIPPEVFGKLASRKVRKIIFRDASFKNTSDKLTAIKRFNELGTEVKVL